MAQQLSERFAPWIESEIEANQGGDDITWEFGIAATQSGLTPVTLIQMPAPVVGECLGAQIIWAKGMLTDEAEVRKIIGEALGSLRQNRSAMLAGVPTP